MHYSNECGLKTQTDYYMFGKCVTVFVSGNRTICFGKSCTSINYEKSLFARINLEKTNAQIGMFKSLQGTFLSIILVIVRVKSESNGVG